MGDVEWVGGTVGRGVHRVIPTLQKSVEWFIGSDEEGVGDIPVRHTPEYFRFFRPYSGILQDTSGVKLYCRTCFTGDFGVQHSYHVFDLHFLALCW